MLNIQIGLVKIPVMSLNFVNNRYSSSGLHQFSECCNAPVGNKKYCKECGKTLTNPEIKKGLDKETILSENQQEKLKELFENGIIEVIGIKDKIDFDKIIPYIQKSQLILPSMSKGFRKTDVKTFFSFKKALGKRVCLVKLIQRSLEHLGILFNKGEDLIFTELAFNNYDNKEEIGRLKEQVNLMVESEKITNLYEFEKEASEFIGNFKSKETNLEKVKEEKLELLNKFVREIQQGVVETTEIKQEVNPFK